MKIFLGKFFWEAETWWYHKSTKITNNKSKNKIKTN